MANKVNSLLLASGEADSTTMAYWLLNKSEYFIPVFINYGQHCMDTELKTLNKVLPSDVLKDLQILNVSDIYRGSASRLILEADLWTEDVSYKDLHLPYRTLLLLSIGAAYAEAQGFQYLYSAFINSNHAQEIDCSANFFSKLSNMLIGYGTVELKMPFRYKSKEEVIRIGIDLGVPIELTYSCQVSSNIPCGACPNCVDRLNAIKNISSVQ